MKKLLVLGLAGLLVACPVACVNDPTDSDAVCPETATDASQCTEVSTSSEVVVDTATDTAE